ncbi:MAG TPA: alpha/beta hydrolase, partial [Pseudonocardia sp.]|nr:alpha/beta hydrolase [Pseudonocardia sp.]
RMWTPQLASLADDHRVVALDARNHGGSSTATGPYRHCDDVAAVIRRLDLGPAVLMGGSMGAGTALDTALEHPELVRGLVISGAGTSEPEFRDPWALGVMDTCQRAQQAGDGPTWVEAFLLFAAGPRRGLDEVAPDVVALCRLMAEASVARFSTPGAVLPAAPVPVGRTWQRLPEVTAPLLAVVGGIDAVDHIAMAERAARGVRHGSTVTVEGTAHYPNLERPDEFDGIVRRFLREVREVDVAP